MSAIIECIPNFSEGRDPAVIERIVEAVSTIPHIEVLDYSLDADHNRSVLTFAGPPKQVQRAAFAATQMAAQLINLQTHQGEHPRIGATDVIPLVPINGISIKDCVSIARDLAAQISRELGIPTYLYEHAATKPLYKNLANIRRGGFERLREEISKPERHPDFGEAVLHPTAGATAVGVRDFLIAYNVNLDTNDLHIAKEIARCIRESSGGIPSVKALGVRLNRQKIVQVTTNLTNFQVASMHDVYMAVKKEAARFGVKVLESEIVGLVPTAAIAKIVQDYLHIKNFSAQQVLEYKILAKKMGWDSVDQGS